MTHAHTPTRALAVPLPRSGPRGAARLAPRTDAGRRAPLAPYRETVTRQFALWPFGTRVLRLYLLVDATDSDPTLTAAIIRAMRDEFLRSEARSQTNALRSALFAAHHVVRAWNQRALTHERVSAAAACAVTRGGTAYVALAGESAALAWDGESLQAHRGGGRVARPLGADVMPKVSFWSAPLAADHQLVLACGAGWKDDSLETARGLLQHLPQEEAQARLEEALAGPDGPARVLLADGLGVTGAEPRARRGPRSTRPLAPAEPRPTAVVRAALVDSPRQAAAEAPRRSPERRRGAARMAAGRLQAGRHVPLLAAALVAGLVLLGLGVWLARPGAEPRQAVLAREAEQALQAAQRAPDVTQAGRLAAQAQALAQQASAVAGSGEYAPLLERAERLLRDTARVYRVTPAAVVRLGGAARAVSDVLPLNDALLALDAAQGTVRTFDAAGRDQPFDAGRTVLRAGDSLGGATLEAPVAMATDGGRVLAVLDRSRGVWIGPSADRLTRRSMPGAAEWKQVDALAADPGRLYLLDALAARLVEYPLGAPDPRPVSTGAAAAPGLPLDRAAELVALEGGVALRTADGAVYRRDGGSVWQPVRVEPPDAPPGPISAIASDRAGGLYLADPTRGRIVHVDARGRYIRQLRPDGWGQVAVRALQAAPRGDRLYYVEGDSIQSVTLPAELPAPL